MNRRLKTCLITRKYAYIGDLLMIIPALKELSKKFQIDLMIPESSFEVFINLDFINKVIPFSNNYYSKEYDKVVDLSNFEFNYEQASQPLIDKTKIELFFNALNLKNINNNIEINLSKKEKDWVNNYFKSNKLDGKKTILFGIKSSNYTRDWPIEKWKRLINRLKKLNYNLIIVDKEINWDDDELIFFNNRTIRELFALVYKSDFIICNDSGLLHIAGAFDKKTLGIFGPTDPKLRCVYNNSHGISSKLEVDYCWYDRDSMPDYFSFIGVSDVERKFLEVTQDEL